MHTDTTGPVAAQRSGKHSYQQMDASVVWRHVQEGAFTPLFQADGKIEGISYAEVIRILSEVHNTMNSTIYLL